MKYTETKLFKKRAKEYLENDDKLDRVETYKASLRKEIEKRKSILELYLEESESAGFMERAKTRAAIHECKQILFLLDTINPE